MSCAATPRGVNSAVASAGFRHYGGADDWIVGLLPKLFELPGFSWLNRDIGGAGFDGFTDAFVRPNETYFVSGGHSAALDDDNIPSVVAFVMKGEKMDINELHARDHPKPLRILSNVCWILWLLGVGLVVAIGWRLPYLVCWILKRLAPSVRRPFSPIAWGSRFAYVILLWAILQTI